MMTGLTEKPDRGLLLRCPSGHGEGGLSTVRFAQWRAFLPHSGLQPRPNAVIPASWGRDQGKHPLQVPGHGHEVPLTADMIEPAQQELAESQHGLDDTEDRFRNVFALGVELLALQRLQSVRHGLDRCRIVRCGWRLGKALAQGGMARPSAISGAIPAVWQASTLAALK